MAVSLAVIFGPMDESLYFTEQHYQVREMVRDFARTHVAPVARELDRTSTFPWENIRRMGELGLLGVPWPEEYGGAGMGYVEYATIIEELSRVDGSVGIILAAHTSLCSNHIFLAGNRSFDHTSHRQS